MKFWLTLATLGLSLAAWAEEGLGTKKDIVVQAPVQSTAPVVGGMELLQMILALVIVGVLLKFGLPKLIGKFGKRLTTQAGGTIQVEETAAFGAGSLQVVSVRGRTILIAVTQQGVNFLTDLTPVPATPSQPEQKVFFDILDEAQKKPVEQLMTHAVVEMPETAPASSAPQNIDEARELLIQARQKKLAELANNPPKEDDAEEKLNRLLRKSG